MVSRGLVRAGLASRRAGNHVWTPLSTLNSFTSSFTVADLQPWDISRLGDGLKNIETLDIGSVWRQRRDPLSTWSIANHPDLMYLDGKGEDYFERLEISL